MDANIRFKILILLVTFILTLQMAKAQVAYKVEKGKPSPISGVIITEEKVIELYKAEKKVIVLEDLRIHDKELVNVYKGHSKDLREDVIKAQSEAFWCKVALGIVSGFLMYRGVTK